MKIETLSHDQLKKLHSDFAKYRDEECNGFAKMSIYEFLDKNQKKYKDVKLNQCDGCSSGLILFGGLHRDERGFPVMTCSAKLYE